MAKLARVPDMIGRAPDLVSQAPKVALPFYHDKRWIAFVPQLKAERGNWCQRCGRGGRIIGDHIVEIKDGGALLDPPAPCSA